MSTETLPLIENWYQDMETGRSFRVVATDGDTIEVQYYNGDISEFDLASWYDSTMIPIEAPEDARAPFDDVDTEDLNYTDSDIHEPGDLTLDDILDDTY